MEALLTHINLVNSNLNIVITGLSGDVKTFTELCALDANIIIVSLQGDAVNHALLTETITDPAIKKIFDDMWCGTESTSGKLKLVTIENYLKNKYNHDIAVFNTTNVTSDLIISIINNMKPNGKVIQVNNMPFKVDPYQHEPPIKTELYKLIMNGLKVYAASHGIGWMIV